jgi:hypothetical protein
MIPVAAGASWLAQLILPLLAWEMSRAGVKKVAGKLAGKTAAELAEGLATRTAGSGAGKLLDRGLAKAAGGLPERFAKAMTTENLTRGLVTGGAGLGGLVAGGMGAHMVGNLLAGSEEGQMPQALASYIGQPEMNGDDLLRLLLQQQRQGVV